MVLALSFSLLFLIGCQSLERDNIYDPYGDNYIGAGGGTSSGGGGESSSSSGDDILSYQGKNYKTVQIGTQTWMAENMNHEANDSKCYDNDPSNCTTYGRLYNWMTAKMVCPPGWHLPSDAEWTKLFNYVDWEITKLKAKSGWSSDGNGLDTYGFSALPGGHSLPGGGDFYGVGDNGYWWSSTETEVGGSQAYFKIIHSNLDNVGTFGDNKNCLRSVRCVRD